jgi:hypothetical protein
MTSRSFGSRPASATASRSLGTPSARGRPPVGTQPWPNSAMWANTVAVAAPPTSTGSGRWAGLGHDQEGAKSVY